jgi:hypothetical protein
MIVIFYFLTIVYFADFWIFVRVSFLVGHNSA